MVFQCINIRQVPREVLKTEAGGRGFQHLSRDLANDKAWQTMFDPYIRSKGLSLVDAVRFICIVTDVSDILRRRPWP